MQSITLPHRRLLLSIITSIAFLLLPAIASAQESITVQLTSMNGSNVSRTILLSANGDATDAVIDLTGMNPGAGRRATLYANTCELPSASFAPIAEFTADANGNVHTTGTILFHDTNVAFADIADGGRIISILSDGQVVACGTVPAVSSPALPNTGAAFDSYTLAILGAFGFLILVAGMLLEQRMRA